MGIFTTLFYQPLFNALMWLYDVIPGNDIGLAIIALTLLIRLLLYPLTMQSIKSQKALQDIQPKVKELQQKYKDNKEQQAQEMMKLYREEKVNPMSSCLPLLIQLPFLFAIYRVFLHGLKSESFELLYPFVSNPGHINTIPFGFLDISNPNIVIAMLAGAAQFWQTKMLVARRAPKVNDKQMPGAKDEDMLAGMNKQMTYFMPLITVVIGASLPGGLALYWLFTTLTMALMQYVVFHRKEKTDKSKIVELPGEHIEKID